MDHTKLVDLSYVEGKPEPDANEQGLYRLYR